MYLFLVGCGHFSWRSISLFNTKGYLICRHSNVWIFRQHPMVLLFKWNFFVRTLRHKILSSVPAMITQPRFWEKGLSIDQSGQARGGGGGGSGTPIYPLFCPQDTNIPQNRNMCDTKYLKLFWNRKKIRHCLNINETTKKNTDFNAVQPMLHV